MPEIIITLSEEDVNYLALLPIAHSPQSTIHRLDNAAIESCVQWVEDNKPKEPVSITFHRGDPQDGVMVTPKPGQAYILTPDGDSWTFSNYGPLIPEEPPIGTVVRDSRGGGNLWTRRVNGRWSRDDFTGWQPWNVLNEHYGPLTIEPATATI